MGAESPPKLTQNPIFPKTQNLDIKNDYFSDFLLYFLSSATELYLLPDTIETGSYRTIPKKRPTGLTTGGALKKYV